VKTSDSSRLCVENSETTAPSSPGWNQCSVSGGIVCYLNLRVPETQFAAFHAAAMYS